MKKVIIVGMLVFLPFTASAQTAAGIEFMTPLVQNIIQLLHDRITELTERVKTLESQKTVYITQACEPVGAPEVDLRDEYRSQIRDIELQILDLRDDINEAKTTLSGIGSGATAYDIYFYNKVIEDSKAKIIELENEKERLTIKIESI